jgi:hypothetical protein
MGSERAGPRGTRSKTYSSLLCDVMWIYEKRNPSVQIVVLEKRAEETVFSLPFRCRHHRHPRRLICRPSW